jgi:DNA replication protein DnaC
MLTQQTLDQLQTLNLLEMARKWQEQQRDTQMAELCFDERFALLVDAQSLTQQNKRMVRLLAEAKLRLPQACVEGVDFPPRRELDKPLWRQLATGQFLADKRGVLVIGATGTGKTYVECALGHLAVRKGYRVRYYRTSRLLDELTLARADGSYSKLLSRLARYDLLILDDFLISPPTEMQRRDLLEVLEDRYGNRSTICGSQLPVETWHAQLGDPTLADALLDRLIHNAYRIVLKGPTRRKVLENAETQTSSDDR